VVSVPLVANALASTPAPTRVRPKDTAWSDLLLTLPIFVFYHLGVVFLPTRNAADLLTQQLIRLAEHSIMAYVGLTVALGTVFIGVLYKLGGRDSLRWQRFAMVVGEGVVYAVILRYGASAVVGQLLLSSGAPTELSPFAAVVLSLGAGFYEELVFRVGLYAVVGSLAYVAIVAKPSPLKRMLFWSGWALFGALVFSGWHHVGALGDPLTLEALVFRTVAGLIFTLIFALRGFGPVVYTHVLYDIWVMVF